jgi:cytochrome c oxidase subunit II
MESSPSFLRTYGFVAGREAWLGWILLGIATVVVLVVSALVLAGALRRGRSEPGRIDREGEGLRWIVIGGIVVPSLVLMVVLVLTVTTQAAIATPANTDLTVRVTGRQWWWEVSYLDRSPSLIATTANEIHIPVGRPVRLEVVSGDVIHSFWIPELNRKIDMIPGQANRLLLEADRAGTYRGQCSEFCGLQHAHMAVKVIAEPMPQFRRWLAANAEPAAHAAGRGEAVFLASACADCHQIRGTAAHGLVGPDLTHVASRTTLAALTIPNTPERLAAWIRDPQHIKPGNRMPDLHLRESDWRALDGYLRSLR